MEDMIQNLLSRVEGRYRRIAKLLHPSLRKWLQYRRADIQKDRWGERKLVLYFETSSESVKFECEVGIPIYMSDLTQSHIELRSKEIYEYFRDIKYSLGDAETV